jgi:hypothetical protein
MPTGMSTELEARLQEKTGWVVPDANDVDGFEQWLSDLKGEHRDLYVEVATEIEAVSRTKSPVL